VNVVVRVSRIICMFEKLFGFEVIGWFYICVYFGILILGCILLGV